MSADTREGAPPPLQQWGVAETALHPLWRNYLYLFSLEELFLRQFPIPFFVEPLPHKYEYVVKDAMACLLSM